MTALLIASGVACDHGGVSGGYESRQAAAGVPPNVLFIAVDDLNDWVEPLQGHPDVRTPNIASLASKGITFTNAHASAPVCNSSRVSLMTGLDPNTTGVFSNRQYPLRDVLPDAETLTRYFMRNGYYVAGFGKIFHRDDNRTEPWDEYLWGAGRPKPGSLPGHGVAALPEDIYRYFDWGPVDAPLEEWGEHKISTAAIEFLNRDHDTPFFAAVGFRLPHLPWYAPREFFDLYAETDVDLPLVPEGDMEDLPADSRWLDDRSGRAHALIEETGRWHDAVVAYLASISFVDSQIGRLLDALEASPYAGDTIVVLWSDHGFHLGEKERWRKFTLWEPSTRVPLIWYAPRVTKPGTRSDQPVSLLDVYPTLVELARLPGKSGLDGISLVPLMKDPASNLSREAVITTDESGRAQSVRSDRWRYIRNPDGGEELYDHESDPEEWSNLAELDEYRAIKDSLAQKLDR